MTASVIVVFSLEKVSASSFRLFYVFSPIPGVNENWKRKNSSRRVVALK